jgi:glycosyltransferase involved in cell wall biosynthesis
MRVLIAHNRYRSAQPSGENAVVDDEARLLAEHGCDVELVQTHSDEISNWPLRKKALLPARTVWSRAGRRLVADSIERYRPDVVHVHNTFPLLSPTALRAARASGAAVVATMHNFRPLCSAATFMRDGKVCTSCLGHGPLPGIVHGCYRDSRLATVPVAATISTHRIAGTWRNSVDRYVFPSAFARSLYLQAGWAPERLVVKPNTAPEPGLRREGSGHGFVALSRFSQEKGLDTLLDAWRDSEIDEPLTLIGSGELDADLRTRAGDLANVEFLGQLSHRDALERLAGARALVVPSRWFEVFPRTIVEAYALGVPVVASRIGSLADVVDDGVTGLLVEPGSAWSLCTALRALAADDARTAQLGTQARRRYDDELAPGPTTRRLLEIYEDARAQASGAPALEAAWA